MLVWKPSTLVFTAVILSKIFSCGGGEKKLFWLIFDNVLKQEVHRKCYLNSDAKVVAILYLGDEVLNPAGDLHTHTHICRYQCCPTRGIYLCVEGGDLRWWWSPWRRRSPVSPAPEVSWSSRCPWWSRTLELKHKRRRINLLFWRITRTYVMHVPQNKTSPFFFLSSSSFLSVSISCRM